MPSYVIEIKNDKARHKLINVKYCQMAFRSKDDTVVGSFLKLFGQTRVMHSHQRETPQNLFWFVSIYGRLKLSCWVWCVKCAKARADLDVARQFCWSLHKRANYSLPSNFLKALIYTWKLSKHICCFAIFHTL